MEEYFWSDHSLTRAEKQEKFDNYFRDKEDPKGDVVKVKSVPIGVAKLMMTKYENRMFFAQEMIRRLIPFVKESPDARNA